MITSDHLNLIDVEKLARHLAFVQMDEPIVLVDSFYPSSRLRAVRLGLSGQAADLAAHQWNIQLLYRHLEAS